MGFFRLIPYIVSLLLEPDKIPLYLFVLNPLSQKRKEITDLIVSSSTQRSYKTFLTWSFRKLQTKEEDAHGRSFQPLKPIVVSSLFLMNVLPF